jgi:hypothetical protein
MTVRAFFALGCALVTLAGCEGPATPGPAGFTPANLEDESDIDLEGPYETVRRP